MSIKFNDPRTPHRKRKDDLLQKKIQDGTLPLASGERRVAAVKKLRNSLKLPKR